MIANSVFEDLNLLTTFGEIGFYRSFEVTEICAMNNKGSAVNLFSVLVASPKKLVNKSNAYFMNKKRFEIMPGIKAGIFRYEVSVSRLNRSIKVLGKA